MTEAAFWGMIRSVLRQKSRFWAPIRVCKLGARRTCRGGGGRQQWEYQCNHCHRWHPEKNIQVDHIRPAGTLRCAHDLPGFVERLFCEADNLQVLCTHCHKLKTQNDNP